MAKQATHGGVFAPKATGAESKLQTTNSVVRTILDAEVKARDAKTARLRQLRLQREAEAPAAEQPAAGKRKRASGKAT